MRSARVRQGTGVPSRREVLSSLGRNVRSWRRQRGLTQESVAELLGISVAYVSLIERGGRNPPYTAVIAFARALGISVAELVREERPSRE
jgi:transcriptional regulator with XRE-family HTH domain